MVKLVVLLHLSKFCKFILALPPCKHFNALHSSEQTLHYLPTQSGFGLAIEIFVYFHISIFVCFCIYVSVYLYVCIFVYLHICTFVCFPPTRGSFGPAIEIIEKSTLQGFQVNCRPTLQSVNAFLRVLLIATLLFSAAAAPMPPVCFCPKLFSEITCQV